MERFSEFGGEYDSAKFINLFFNSVHFNLHFIFFFIITHNKTKANSFELIFLIQKS